MYVIGADVNKHVTPPPSLAPPLALSLMHSLPHSPPTHFHSALPAQFYVSLR